MLVAAGRGKRGFVMLTGMVLLQLTLKPAAIAMAGGLLVSLLGALILSLVIKRREAMRTVEVGEPARIQFQRIQRATSSDLPDDVQKRLLLLTADLDRSLAEAAQAEPPKPAPAPTSYAPPASSAASPAASARPAARPSLPDDKTQTFGRQQSDEVFGLSHVNHLDDRTTPFFGPEPVPAQDDDATRFFGGDDDAVDPRDFFGEDLVPVTPASAEQDDATRFFASEETENANLAPTATDFFGPLDGPDGQELIPDGPTGMLHALPPAAQPPATTSAAVPMPETEGFVSTGALHALPRPQPRVDGDALNRVRARLDAAALPQVVALTVLDGTGRVLVGETDQDFTGELRSLMAEAGMGSATEVDQPVRLADSSRGAILLVPTGVNALLGALVLETGDPQATRAGLHRLAHEIGDAMRRAS